MIEKMMKSLVKLAIGVINLSLLTVLGFLAYMKYQEIRCVDTVFEVVDSRLGIVRGDYNIVRRGARIFVMQDPSALQKIKLNAKGRAKVNEYVLAYTDSLQTIGNQVQSVQKNYAPVVDYSKCYLSNSIPGNVYMKSFNEILEDTEEAYTRMQTSQVGRYFEQYCWLGGDFWKVIIDTKTGIIYRKYGSI